MTEKKFPKDSTEAYENSSISISEYLNQQSLEEMFRSLQRLEGDVRDTNSQAIKSIRLELLEHMTKITGAFLDQERRIRDMVSSVDLARTEMMNAIGAVKQKLYATECELKRFILGVRDGSISGDDD